MKNINVPGHMKSSMISYASRAALLMLILYATVCASCLRHGLVHAITPVERPDVETTRYGTAMIRSLYCDIMVEPVDAGLWRAVRKSNSYGTNPHPGTLQRTPPLIAFQVVVKNTVNAPIRLQNVQLCLGSRTIDALTADGVRDRLKSSSYSGFNLDALFSSRRLISEPVLHEAIDYDRDTIDMSLDFIPPRDSVLTIRAFERPPVASRAFRLRFVIAAMGSLKTIDFDFTRDEHRTRKTNSREQYKKERTDHDE
jgi:hypothetical protein